GKLVDLLLFLLGRVGGRRRRRLLRLLGRLLFAGILSRRHGNGRENQRRSEESCGGTRKERGHGGPDDARATELTRTHCNTRIGHLCGAAIPLVAMAELSSFVQHLSGFSRAG